MIVRVRCLASLSADFLCLSASARLAVSFSGAKSSIWSLMDTLKTEGAKKCSSVVQIAWQDLHSRRRHTLLDLVWARELVTFESLSQYGQFMMI